MLSVDREVAASFMLLLCLLSLMGPSLCPPSVMSQSTSISWKGAVTHVWCPDFCIYCQGKAP